MGGKCKFNPIGTDDTCKSCGATFLVTETVVRSGHKLCRACNNARIARWHRKNTTYSWDRERTKYGNAHTETARAIRLGILKRAPCEVCGSTVRVEAHHEDYSKPLDVRWLCRPHHMERHDELKKKTA